MPRLCPSKTSLLWKKLPAWRARRVETASNQDLCSLDRYEYSNHQPTSLSLLHLIVSSCGRLPSSISFRPPLRPCSRSGQTPILRTNLKPLRISVSSSPQSCRESRALRTLRKVDTSSIQRYAVHTRLVLALHACIVAKLQVVVRGWRDTTHTRWGHTTKTRLPPHTPARLAFPVHNLQTAAARPAPSPSLPRISSSRLSLCHDFLSRAGSSKLRSLTA